ncbi:MAG: hypothetical protein BWK79_06725 [Beggiatoa sp. IS2]|nr:MAG: hypothetical protein BWK79_06725 [Beggiatoa sp. IS2]
MNIKRLTALYIIFLLLLLMIVNQGDYRFILKPFYDFPNGDKVVHIILMGLLALLVNLNFQCAQFKLFNIPVLTGSALVLTIVFLEECSQLFIKSRTFDLWDLFSDVVGIVLFGQLALRLSRSQSSVPH